MSAQELIDLSARKWQWMSERDVEALARLFHDDAVFVHMGATFGRAEELEVIATGGIHYKQVDIQGVSVPFLNQGTAILLNKIELLAVVGGNEVINPFVVTEVYIREAGSWELASMSFTKLLTP